MREPLGRAASAPENRAGDRRQAPARSQPPGAGSLRDRVPGQPRQRARPSPVASTLKREGRSPPSSRALEEVDVRGSVITLDALHTTRNTALRLRRCHGAHYLFTVKGNAPETFQTLETIDWDRDATSHFFENHEKAHGRIERRRIQVLEPLEDLINYPSVRQIFRITRKRYQVTTGKASIEVAYDMTSLPPEPAAAERLLALNRGHWVVENRNHRPRDTTFGEDACLMHTGHGPSNGRHRQPHGARHHLPSRLPPRPSCGPTLCHGPPGSDPCGHRTPLRCGHRTPLREVPAPFASRNSPAGSPIMECSGRFRTVAAPSRVRSGSFPLHRPPAPPLAPRSRIPRTDLQVLSCREGQTTRTQYEITLDLHLTDLRDSSNLELICFFYLQLMMFKASLKRVCPPPNLIIYLINLNCDQCVGVPGGLTGGSYQWYPRF